VAIVLSLIAVVVLHQLSYTNDIALASPLSDLIEVITACRLPDPEASKDTYPQDISTIPNLVHQIWKTADVHTYSIEASYKAWKTSFGPLDYKVKLWTEDDVLRLIKANYSWLLSTYEGYPQNIQRADVARLVVIHAEGGMYADLDVYPTSADTIICLQHQGLQAVFAPTGGTLGLSNHFFMAERGSPFLLWALQEAKRRGGPMSKRILLPYLQVFWSTGPIMVTSVFQQYVWMYNTAGHELGVLHEQYGRSVVRHKAGRSWHRLDGYLLNWVADNVQMEKLWLSALFLAAVLGYMCMMARRRGCRK
jgi:mannosyltransferase OCH1-like enzyme